MLNNKIEEDINLSSKISDILKKNLLDIYEDYKHLPDDSVDKIMLKKKVDEVLESMFKTNYSYSIPMDFIISPLGRMLFEIKLDIENARMYGYAEITIIAGKSKQMISMDHRNGILKGIEIGKKRRVLVTEEALYEYITTVGKRPFSPDEAKKRISQYNELINNGYSEDEIKEIFRK